MNLTNSKNQSFWDWQVTIAYYVAVHVINAHIAKVADLHYRTHEHVKVSINPYNQLAICRIPEDIYLSYTKIEALSRRARYLCNTERRIANNETAQFTYDKHFAKAIRHLDNLLEYFSKRHNFIIQKTPIVCQELTSHEGLKHFIV